VKVFNKFRGEGGNLQDLAWKAAARIEKAPSCYTDIPVHAEDREVVEKSAIHLEVRANQVKWAKSWHRTLCGLKEEE